MDNPAVSTATKALENPYPPHGANGLKIGNELGKTDAYRFTLKMWNPPIARVIGMTRVWNQQLQSCLASLGRIEHVAIRNHDREALGEYSVRNSRIEIRWILEWIVIG